MGPQYQVSLTLATTGTDITFPGTFYVTDLNLDAKPIPDAGRGDGNIEPIIPGNTVGNITLYGVFPSERKDWPLTDQFRGAAGTAVITYDQPHTVGDSARTITVAIRLLSWQTKKKKPDAD